VHRLDPLEQAEQGRVHGAHHGRGQGHVGLDQGGELVDRAVLVGHQQGQFDQGARAGRQVDVQVAQLRGDAHGGLSKNAASV
jgi:hypothetical protein